MADLPSLLCIYPILDSLAAQLNWSDLINLSRSNTWCRAVLHGLSTPNRLSSYIPGSRIRGDLCIGDADTPFWRNLKGKTQLVCAEPGHTKGKSPKGCKLCSMPICKACVVKASFNKNENTFGNRRRQLCESCWALGNPHKECLHFGSGTRVRLNYVRMARCRCTADDGFLCLRCKFHQNSTADLASPKLCSGRGCYQPASLEQGGRICLWCKLPLPGARVIDKQRWREYEARYPEVSFESQSPSTSTPTPSQLPRPTSYADQRHPGSPASRRAILRNYQRPRARLVLDNRQGPAPPAPPGPPVSEDAPSYEQQASDLQRMEQSGQNTTL